MDEYILPTIKKLLAIDENDEFWDTRLVPYLNGTFAIMHSEMGVDPQFVIGSEGTEKWTDWIDDEKKLAYIIPYVKFKTQQQFDPPTISAMEEAMNTNIDMYEFFIRDLFDFPEETTAT